MANTSPVTDTAEAAEHVAALGRRDGYAEVVPVGAVSKGLAGTELAELGLMARSAAGVRVFSDDGHCVADARLMRRALEYVRAFDGVIAQHAQDPAARRRGGLLPRGRDLRSAGAARLAGGRRGRHRGPRRPAGRADPVAAARLPRVHRGDGRGAALGQGARASPVTAEVTPHHLLLTTDEVVGYDPTYKVNPPLRPAEDVDGAAGRAGRRHHRRGRAPTTRRTPGTTRSTPSPRRPSACSGWRPRSAWCWRPWSRPGRLDWARGRRADVGSRRPGSPGCPTRAGRWRSATPPTWSWSTRTARAIVDRTESASRSRNNPWHGRELPDPVVATIWAGSVTYRR